MQLNDEGGKFSNILEKCFIQQIWYTLLFMIQKEITKWESTILCHSFLAVLWWVCSRYRIGFPNQIVLVRYRIQFVSCIKFYFDIEFDFNIEFDSIIESLFDIELFFNIEFLFDVEFLLDIEFDFDLDVKSDFVDLLRFQK